MQLPTEMYVNYVHRRNDDYEKLVDALKNLDTGTFKKIGHQLKGNAPSFGFDELTELALRMCAINDNNLESDGTVIVDKLKQWIDEKTKSLTT